MPFIFTRCLTGQSARAANDEAVPQRSWVAGGRQDEAASTENGRAAEVADALSAVIAHYAASRPGLDVDAMSVEVARLRDTPQVPSESELAEFCRDIQGRLMRAIEGPTTRPQVVRDLPRLPTEVVMHWMAGVQQMQGTLGAGHPGAGGLHDLMETAKQQWLRHELALPDVQAFLGEAMQRGVCKEIAPLAALAKSLLAELARHDATPPTTRLFENIYGRAYESAMVGRLFETPPAGVRSAMEQMGNALMAVLAQHATTGAFADGLELARRKLVDDRRFWTPAFALAQPEFNRFLETPVALAGRVSSPAAMASATERLRAMLCGPVASGLDCIARPYLVAKLLLAMAEVGIELPGVDLANTNYAFVITPQNSRRDPSSADSLERAFVRTKHVPLTSDAALMLAHQPTMVTGPHGARVSHRAALRVEPCYPRHERSNEISGQRPALRQPVRFALENGIPFIAGLSGSTNLMLHFCWAVSTLGGGADRQLPPIDLPHAMLGTWMLLAYDGGHSLHEALWVIQQTASDLRHDIPAGGPAAHSGSAFLAADFVVPELARSYLPHDVPPEGYVQRDFRSDYAAYFDSFPKDTRDALYAASDAAFDATIQMRRYYVSENAFD